MNEVRIHHYLKDGRSVENIADHVIKSDEFPVLYEVIHRIQKENGTDEKINSVRYC